MNSKEALDLLRSGPEGVRVWNEWTNDDPWRSKIQEVDLSGADLRGLDLRGIRFGGEDFTGAELLFTSFGIWEDPDIPGANLRGANLSYANLSEADFFLADLRETVLHGAIISGANFRKARLARTILTDLDLKTAVALGECIFESPSSIGIDTILKSQGAVPEEFLRGCGYNPLVQRLILGEKDALAATQSRSEEGKRFLLNSCFISYSTKDKHFVDRLQHDLNKNGVDYWYAPEHGKWGKELTRQIESQIQNRDRVLLVCSYSSLESDWVQWEIEKSIQQEEMRGKRILFPIMVDDSLLHWNHPRATHIREVLAADFRDSTNFESEHEKKMYKKQLRRLITALQLEVHEL